MVAVERLATTVSPVGMAPEQRPDLQVLHGIPDDALKDAHAGKRETPNGDFALAQQIGGKELVHFAAAHSEGGRKVG